MIHRTKKENDENRDKWIGLGGKLECGESPYDCVKREIFEESGLILDKPRYRGIVTFVSDEYGTEYMHLFTADGYTGELKECDEGVLEWIPKEKLLEIPHWEGDAIFLDLIDKDVPFFSLKLCYRGEELEQAVLNGSYLKGEPRV